MRADKFIRDMEAEAKKTQGYKRAPKYEAEIASRFGGKVTPGSGSKNQKGDVMESGNPAKLKTLLRVECKSTQRKSFSVTRDMLQKIEDAALPRGESPVIVVEFLDANGNKESEFAVMPMYLLEELCGG